MKPPEPGHERVAAFGVVDVRAQGCGAIRSETLRKQAPIGVEQVLCFEFNRLDQEGQPMR
ncbi:MAG: hypothetical protein ABL916_01705 [Burkholderiaceae bacterium]